MALPGETKESLAKRAGLKVRKFMQFNDLFAFDNIVVGQPYFVQKKRDKSEVEYHVAQQGESVATVSQKYGIRAKAIWSKNRMPRNEELRPGRILWLKHTRPKEVAIEYADSKNEAALAAFERPSSKPVAATPTPVAAAEPVATPVAKPAPKKRRIDDTEPYMGKTASAVRVLEDAVEGTDEPAATGVVTQPDSATDATTENLNELAPAPVSAPVAASKPAPREPVAAAPAPLPTRKALPAATPIGDEPAAGAAEEPTEDTPLPRPFSKPAAPVAKPAPASRPTTAEATSAPAAASAPRPLPPAAPASTGTVEAIPATGLHTVQAKETLYSVARRYGLRPADLVAWNNLPQNPSLRLGQVLRVTAETAPAAPVATPAAPSSPRTGVYQPKAGSVPATTPAAPAPTSASASPATAAMVRHTVAAGESMYAISRKYGVTIKQIMEWNNKPDFNVKPGEVLLVQPAK